MLGVILAVLLAVSMLPVAGLASAFADEPAARPETVDGDVVLEGTSDTSAVAGQTREDGMLVADGLVYTVIDGGLSLAGFDGLPKDEEAPKEIVVPEAVSADGQDATVVAVSIAEGNVAEDVVSLTLPQSITDVDTATLAAAFPNLATVEVASSASSAAPVAAGAAALSAAYSSFGGLLFRNAGPAPGDGEATSFSKELVWAPPATVVARIPAECSSIAPGAFADAKGLKTVVCFGVMGEIPQAKKAEDGTVIPGAFIDEQIQTVDVIVPQTGTVVPDPDGDRVSADVAVTDHSTMDIKREAWWKSGFASDRITLGEVYGSMTNTLPVTEAGTLEPVEAEVAYAPETTQNYSSRKAGIKPPESAIPTPVPDDDELDSSESGLVFTHLADMTLSVSWKGDRTATPAHLDIPAYATINGVTYPVTEIAPEAFKGAVFLTSVTIPEGVTTIGDSAFDDCANLAEVSVPVTVKAGGSSVSGETSSLAAATVSASAADDAPIVESADAADARETGQTFALVPEGAEAGEAPSAIGEAPAAGIAAVPVEDEGISAYAATSVHPSIAWYISFPSNATNVEFRQSSYGNALSLEKVTTTPSGISLGANGYVVKIKDIGQLVNPTWFCNAIGIPTLSYTSNTIGRFVENYVATDYTEASLMLRVPMLDSNGYYTGSTYAGEIDFNLPVGYRVNLARYSLESVGNDSKISMSGSALGNFVMNAGVCIRLSSTSGATNDNRNSGYAYLDAISPSLTQGNSAHSHTSATDGGLLAKSTLTSVLGTNNETYQKPGSYAASSHNHDGTYAKKGTAHTSTNLDDYALTSQIPSLSGYATQKWVTDKGYLTSASLNGYATQAWVGQQGYATTSSVDTKLSSYATTTALNNGLAGKANASHTHTAASITDLKKYGKSDAVAWADVSGKPSTFTPSSHTHDDRYYTETEVNNLLAGKSNTNHNHDSAYAAKSHTHDDRYFTETEVTNKLAGKSDTGHTHDDRYYTEGEVDSKLSAYVTTTALGTTLSSYLTNKTAADTYATKQTVSSLATTVSGKADKAALDALSQTVAGKADAPAVNDALAKKLDAGAVSKYDTNQKIDDALARAQGAAEKTAADALDGAKTELRGDIDDLAKEIADGFGTIRYEGLDGDSDAGVYPTSYKAGGTPSLHAPSREGWDFAGWTWKRGNASGTSENLADAFAEAGEVTLTATWAQEAPKGTYFFTERDPLLKGAPAPQEHVIKVVMTRTRSYPVDKVEFSWDNWTGLIAEGASITLTVGTEYDEATGEIKGGRSCTLTRDAAAANKAAISGLDMTPVQFASRQCGLYVGISVPDGAIDKVVQSYVDGSYVDSLVKMSYTMAA